MSNLTRTALSCTKKETKTCKSLATTTIECEKDSNGKGILPSRRSPIEVIQWPMSLGKTFQQQLFIANHPDERHVYVVPTQALAQEAANRLNLPCYLDFEPGDTRWYGSMVVCIASFKKVLGAIKYLYVDEIESCLQQLNSKTIFSAEEAQQTYFALVQDIADSRKVTLMDAYAGEATLELIDHAGRLEETHILTAEVEPVTWVDMGSKQKHQLLIHQRVRKGKRLAVGCSSKNEAITLSETLKKDFAHLDIRCYHSDNFDNERSKHSEPFICDVLIYTNVIGSGVSIDVQNHYDERHVIICEGTGNSRNIQQMSGRVRHPIDTKVYFSGDNRTAKEVWKSTPERLLHNWALAKEDSIRILDSLNITVGRHFERDEIRMALLNLLACIESSSIANGKDWAATWIRQNMLIEENEEEIENEDEIKAQLKETREEIKEARAFTILNAKDVSPEEAQEIERKYSKTDAERAILEKQRLKNQFGDGFTEATEEEQSKIIREDEHGKLTRKAKNFAALTLFQTERGKKIIAKRDAAEISVGLDNQLKHTLQRTQIIQDILYKADINWEKGSLKINRLAVSDAYWYAKRQKEDLERLGLVAPPQDSQMKWLSSFLDTIGIKLLSIKRSSQTEDVEQDDGTTEKVTTRQREYQIDLASVERMKRLSEHMQNRWQAKYGQGEKQCSEGTVEASNASKILSSTEYNYLLQKVVDTQLASIKNAHTTDMQGFIRPSRPPLHPLSLSLKSFAVDIDIEAWKRATENRVSHGKKATEIQSWIEQKLQKGERIAFTKTISTLRCPRKYPIIVDETRSKDDGLLMLSSLSKELRATIDPGAGREMLDFDMKTANLSILAAVSKDDAMSEWLKGDAHQSTGDLLLKGQNLTAKQRRKIGKVVNNSMVAGAGVYWLKGKLEEFGVRLTYRQAESLHNAWWDRFPEAQAFRANHQSMIAEKVANGDSHSLRWYGQQMFYFDAELLSGQRGEKGWPESIEKRQEKAERSAFTALLRAYESMIMDHVLIEAKRLGADLICPMFDGALFAIPSQDVAVSEAVMCMAAK